jgi:hypothetical protein
MLSPDIGEAFSSHVAIPSRRHKTGAIKTLYPEALSTLVAVERRRANEQRYQHSSEI